MKKFSLGKAVKTGSFLTAAIALSSFGGTSANAATVTIGGITVTDNGRVSPAVPNSTQPTSVATTGVAQVQIGQPNSAGNPPALSNAGGIRTARATPVTTRGTSSPGASPSTCQAAR